MRYDAVIFDLDGTLLDTLGDLRNSVNHALKLHGFPERTLEEICSFVGNGVRNLMTHALPEEIGEERFEALFADFKAHYAVHYRDLTRPYDGVIGLVAALRERGLKLAVVSNKSDAEVKGLVADIFGDVFDSVVGERPGIPRKPAPDSVLLTLEALGTARERAVYVGDSEVDVRTAGNAALDCVAVTWGFRTREELAENGAETFIDKPEQLLELL